VTSNSRSSLNVNSVSCTEKPTRGYTTLTPLTRTEKSIKSKKCTNSECIKKDTNNCLISKKSISTIGDNRSTKQYIPKNNSSKVAPVLSKIKVIPSEIETNRSSVLKYQYKQLKSSLASLAVDSDEIDEIFALLSNTTEMSTLAETLTNESSKEHRPSSHQLKKSTNSVLQIHTEKTENPNLNKDNKNSTTISTEKSNLKNQIEFEPGILSGPAPVFTKNFSNLENRSYDKLTVLNNQYMQTNCTTNIVKTNEFEDKTKSLCTAASTPSRTSTATTSTFLPNRKFKSRAKKDLLFASIERQLKAATTVPPVRPTFSEIVKKHPPNNITPRLTVIGSLSSQQYEKKCSKDKKKKKTRQLYNTRRRVQANRLTIVSNNYLAEIEGRTTTMTTENGNVNENNDGTKSDEWNSVTGKKNHRLKDAIPLTSLTPKTKHPAASPPKLTYCLCLGITPGTNMTNPIVITARLISKVLASFQHVIPNSQINPIDDEHSSMTDPKKLFDMDDSEINQYVWVHNTKSDSYRCSFKFASDQDLNHFKLDKAFLSWLQLEKIQIDKTYLLGQESVRVGFMLCTETRGDLLELLEKRVRNRFATQWKWQFDLHSAWIRSKEDVSVKVAMFRAPKILENDIIKEFHKLFNYGRSITFYPWNDFVDLSEVQRHNIVKEQLNFQADYRTVSFSGLLDFDDNLSLVDKTYSMMETHKRKFVLNDTDTSIQAGTTTIHGPHPIQTILR
jgi:hypothetical protein